MKKILFASAVILVTSFTACTKDNSVQPTSAKASKLSDAAKQDLGQGDSAKQDLGQGDGK